ncbi:type II toxin-antitoxin system PemK/MazF family toxin [Lacticaseibacillus camelliae]|uniref:type II toxin-antitoxin system PemK/MazF family toxin n=1 Tax=Lacticaseibacillus camelliae TaxID=381742 RepID=UPI000B307C74
MIVLSNTDYNQLTGMVVGMAITTTDFADMSGYLPFVDLESKTKGNIILWQLPTFDQVARHASIIGHVSPSMLNTLKKKVAIDIFE